MSTNIRIDGNRLWEETITTPKGLLHHAGATNEITPWETEYDAIEG